MDLKKKREHKLSLGSNVNVAPKGNTEVTLMDEVITNVIKVLRRLGLKVEESYQQEPVDSQLVEGYFIRIVTGFERGGYRRWSEIGIFYPKADEPITPEKWNEIVLEISNTRPFKYHSGHEELFGRTVFVFVKNKGFLKTMTRKRGISKEIYVPVNIKTGEDNVKTVVNVYLANLFLNRVRSLEAELTTRSRGKLSLWTRYRLLLSGKVRSLSLSLQGFYNYILEFSKNILSRSNATELCTTLNLLAELFFTFLKEADKYARKIFKNTFVEKIVESAKRIVDITELPELLKDAYHYALRMKNETIRSEAEKLLNLISSAEIRRR